MSLNNSISDAIKVVESGREVKYSSEPFYWTGSDTTVRLPIYFTLTRKSTMSFKYLGLTKEAAESAAESLRRDYTRKYMRWSQTVIENKGEAPTVLINQESVFECSSSIQAKMTEGDRWEVDASIDETDVIVTLEEVTQYDDFLNLFQLAEQRESSSGGSLAIMSASWRSNVESGSIECDYNDIISNFNWQNVSVEIKSGNTWSAAELIPGKASKGHVEFYSAENCTFRLKYSVGSITSREWTTKDKPVPNFVIESATSAESGYQQHSPSVTSYNLTTSISIVFNELTGLAEGSIMSPRVYKAVIKCSGVEQRADISSVTSLGGGRYRMSIKYINRIYPVKPTILFLYKDLLSSNEVTVEHDAQIVMTSIEFLGPSHAHDTATAKAFKFRATFTTDLPQTDAMAASVRVNDTNSDWAAVAGTTTVSKTGDVYFIEWVTANFSSGYDRWYAYFYVQITSSGTDYFSNLKHQVIEPLPLEIVTVAANPGLTVTFEQHLKDFDIDNLQLYRYGQAVPSAPGDGFTLVSTESSGDNHLIVLDDRDGVFKLKYTASDGTVTWSPEFANSGIAFLKLAALVPDGDKLKAEWSANFTISQGDTSRMIYAGKSNGGYATLDQSEYPKLLIVPAEGASWYYLVAQNSADGQLYYSAAVEPEEA